MIIVLSWSAARVQLDSGYATAHQTRTTAKQNTQTKRQTANQTKNLETIHPFSNVF